MPQTLILAGLLLFSRAAAAPPAPGDAPEASPRSGIAAGMGVLYLSARDVVDLVNSSANPAERVAQFRAVAEFFGAASFPVSDEWIVKVEYAFLTGSYSVTSFLGAADFSVTAHMPSVIIQYVIAERGLYNLKVGAGGGYYAGTLAEKYLTIDQRFSGTGAGVLAELEANTAFGEHLYAFLGVNLRWSFIGELTSESGRAPGRASGGGGTTLNFFAAGARIGLSYYF